MPKNISPLLLISSILATAAAGVILKYFDLDAHIILLGFRFHLGCVLPFIFIVSKIPPGTFKQYFTSPVYKNHLLPVLWLIIPLVFTAVLYVTEMIELSDPEYFYELGLSSIIDYPIYLLWNLPQLSLLFIFLKTVQQRTKAAMFIIPLVIIFLFFYEFISFDMIEPDYTALSVFIMLSVSGAILIKYFSNVYWFGIVLFTVLWSGLLLYGTGSSSLTNIFFASTFSSWEGFFTGGKQYTNYLIPAYIGSFFLLLILSAMVSGRQSGKR